MVCLEVCVDAVVDDVCGGVCGCAWRYMWRCVCVKGYVLKMCVEEVERDVELEGLYEEEFWKVFGDTSVG